MFCVLAFVFRVFDFRLLSFMFCVSACFLLVSPRRGVHDRYLRFKDRAFVLTGIKITMPCVKHLSNVHIAQRHNIPDSIIQTKCSKLTCL